MRLLMIDGNPSYYSVAKVLNKRCRQFEYPQFTSNGQVVTKSVEKNLQMGELLPEIILMDFNRLDFKGWNFFKYFQQTKKRVLETTVIYLLSSSVSFDGQGNDKHYPFVKSTLQDC
ncbi:hypothetical protein SNE25_09105 [Mucilaginibacter sabulilitoris]|uniref:Response regulatory domain-containing protein n=1 Tax=Mucilaginibacter sabulilitoris TaxID=1173583 RepID=A0ABZ0TV59_9SPHI|nr:hypothetical protein [Mucilaginibacter sabulilitoris]WPU95674.1 hypothetical protein SNE25_09105 [Mucilaginibacter sabulilitoris]